MTYLILILFSMFCTSASALHIQDALQKGWLEMNTYGTEYGSVGKCLKVELRNISSSDYRLEIPLGAVFETSEEHTQNMVVCQPFYVELKSGELLIDTLHALCIEPHHTAPHPKVNFKYSYIAAGKLLKIVQFVHHQRLYDGAGSALVWNVINGSNVFFACDVAEQNFTAMKKFFQDQEVFRFMDCKNISTHQDVFTPRPLITYKTIFQMKLVKNSDMEISLFDERGNTIKQFIKTNSSKGDYEYDFEFTNSTLIEGQKYVIQLIVDGVVRTKRWIKA